MNKRRGEAYNPYDSITCTGSMGIISACVSWEEFRKHPLCIRFAKINIFSEISCQNGWDRFLVPCLGTSSFIYFETKIPYIMKFIFHIL